MPGKPQKSPGGEAIPPHLRARLRAAQLDHQTSHDALRVAVCDYVDDMRARGLSAEEALRSIKRLTAELDGATPRPRDGKQPVGATQSDGLVVLMLEWCNERWHKRR